MQVEDERRHADQYKEQVLTHQKQSDTRGKTHFLPRMVIQPATHDLSLSPSVSPCVRPPVRWRKPTLV